MTNNISGWDMDEEYQMAMYGELDDDILEEMGEFGDDPDLEFDDWDDNDDEEAWMEDEYNRYEAELDSQAEHMYMVDKWESTAQSYLDAQLAELGNAVESLVVGKLSNEARDAAFETIWHTNAGGDDYHVAQEGWNNGWALWCEEHLGGE